MKEIEAKFMDINVNKIQKKKKNKIKRWKKNS